jgi:hypothetical protein
MAVRMIKGCCKLIKHQELKAKVAFSNHWKK